MLLFCIPIPLEAQTQIFTEVGGRQAMERKMRKMSKYQLSTNYRLCLQVTGEYYTLFSNPSTLQQAQTKACVRVLNKQDMPARERKHQLNAVNPIHAQTARTHFRLCQQQGSQASGGSGSGFTAQSLLQGSVFFCLASLSPLTMNNVLFPPQTLLLNLRIIMASPPAHRSFILR